MTPLSLFQDEVKAMRTLRILNAMHIQRLEEGLATAAQANIFKSTAGAPPQNEPSALQDIDLHSNGYSAGLSGRLAS